MTPSELEGADSTTASPELSTSTPPKSLNDASTELDAIAPSKKEETVAPLKKQEEKLPEEAAPLPVKKLEVAAVAAEDTVPALV